MSTSRSERTALVTGANQGLGRALVAGLAATLGPDDRVLLTGRHPGRVADAAAEVSAGLPAGSATVEGRVLDVRDPAAIHALAGELGSVDIVFSNAYERMHPGADPATEVDAVAETSNVATSEVLRAFGPRLRAGGRLVVVASAMGTLGNLDSSQVRERFATAAEADLDAVDRLVEEWREAVLAGRAEEEGFGTWLNVSSKVAQVAAVRAYARHRRERDLRDGTLVASLCPGLVDTDASRPWFEDMSAAQSTTEAAAWPVELVLGSADVAAWHGELVQFGRVLPWESGGPVPQRVAG